MQPSSRRIIIILPLLLAFLAASAALWAWSPTPERRLPPKPSGLVRTAPVANALQGNILRVSGVTRARHQATLSFSVPARIASRPVDTGQRVHRGQLLASLDPSQFRHASSAAEAAVAEVRVRIAQARRDLARAEQLHVAGALPQDQLEQMRALVQGLEAALAAANAQRSDARRLVSETTLTAPFDGTITAVGAEPGEMAAPGHPIVLLSGDGPLQLQVEVPESAALRLREGMTVRVELPFADGHAVKGHVDQVARAAAGPGRLFPILVDLEPDEKVVAGMTADTLFDLGGEDAVCVPVRAVLNPGASRPFVFRVEQGLARRVDVTLGDLFGDCVSVRGSIAKGDRVVVEGHTSLIDGDAIREVP